MLEGSFQHLVYQSHRKQSIFSSKPRFPFENSSTIGTKGLVAKHWKIPDRLFEKI